MREQMSLEEMTGYMILTDDPDVITEADVAGGEYGIDTRVVECDGGYVGCAVRGMAEWMIWLDYDECWMCEGCYGTMLAEYEDYMDAARYG
jgi:hypothetical protein